MVEAKEEDEEEEKKEKKEKEDNKLELQKKFPLLPCLVQVGYCYSGLAKGVPFVDLFSCFF